MRNIQISYLNAVSYRLSSDEPKQWFAFGMDGNILITVASREIILLFINLLAFKDWN